MKLFLDIAFLLVLLTAGSYFLFFPQNVQSLAMRMVDVGLTSNSQWLKAFVQSNSYIVNVRAVGVLAYIMAILVAYVIYKNI